MMTGQIPLRRLSLALSACALFLVGGCSGGHPEPDPIEFTVPSGASLSQVADTLVARDLVRYPRAFRAIARVRGDDRGIRAGRYRVPADAGWLEILDQLVAGRVVTVPLMIPEGFTLRQIAPRVAAITEMDVEDVERRLQEEKAAEEWSVPGPGLEGYLFPDTYHFAPGVTLETVLHTLTERYRSFWTPEARAEARALGLSEQEVTTLAAIVQAEARREDEMRIISGVFHNRLRVGYLLQADPTVQYALGERRSRLLYADIDAVEDHPYNTYSQPGLPPGPIGAPGASALEATLNPADVEYLYFVARPDGSHVFSRTLTEHNQARIQTRREWDELQRRRGSDG